MTPSLIPVPSLGPATLRSRWAHTTPEGIGVPSNVEWSGGVVPDAIQLFEKAGPRADLYFDGATARAAVVTCGGLCPGLNNVIRSIYLELFHFYGVQTVYGFLEGYRGLDPKQGEAPIRLNGALVDDIHRDGGTILGTSRGPVDPAVAVDHLISLGVNMLFTVGGDGTQRGALAIEEEARRRRHPLVVVGIPKTIDNDIPHVDRTFGYTSAVETAREVIDCAHTEAHSVRNGVSVVKLMGRHAGFIAAAAAVASQDVNFCLIPELPFRLEGEKGFLEALRRRLEARRHAVIVIAEGAGQDLIACEGEVRDASGNLKLKDIGKHFCDALAAWSKATGFPMVLRYFDPSYQIRGRAANTEDSMLCDRYARHAVHAAMAGKTGLVIGLVHGQFVHVPMAMVCAGQKRVRPEGELWRAVLAATGQPAAFV